MRFLHSADWHLGRLFHGASLIDDQAHVLEQFVALARESRVDAILLAGDIYDRAVPPVDAVALLNDTLSRLSLDVGVPVFVIAGNHDSGERLAFGSKLLAAQGVHLEGRCAAPPTPVVLEDEHGVVEVFTLPYLEPANARELLDDADLRDHDAALGAMLSTVRNARTERRRSIVLAHAFVAGSLVSDSERPLSIGGSSQVAADRFEGFNYVALGHLHRPQSAGRDAVRYSGSLLPYSFSEIGHEKSVTCVEMASDGKCSIEAIELSPRRRVRRIEGKLEEVLRGPSPGESSDDYLVVRLLDSGALLNPMSRLRDVYPNVLHIERPVLEHIASERGAAAQANRGPTDLFADFFAEVTGAPLGERARETYREVVSRMSLTGEAADDSASANAAEASE